jgi:hypothetical protein
MVGEEESVILAVALKFVKMGARSLIHVWYFLDVGNHHLSDALHVPSHPPAFGCRSLP